jgi:cobalt-zinc-cadmium efflux system outer membrane protein
MIFKLLPLAGVLAILGLVRAEASSSGLIVTFNNIPDRVRRQNPDLAAARFRIQEALGHMHQAGRRPNPEFEAGFEHNTEFREGLVEIGISQRFPVTDRLRMEKEISGTELKAAEAEVREVERRLVAEARKNLVDVLAIRQQRELRKALAAVSQSLADFTKDVAERGELSPIDAGQAKLEAARYSNEIRSLDAAEAAAVGLLKPLLGMQPSERLNVSGTLPPASLPPGVADPKRRPDYQAAELDAIAAGQNIVLEQARKYEDIEAGIFAGIERSEDAPEGYENEGILAVRVKIPLPLCDKNEGNVEAAKARHARKKSEAVALAHSIRHEASAAKAEMIEWNKLIRETTETLIPLAGEQAELAETAYRDGQGDLQSVLRAREQQLELTSSKVEALRNFHHARVRFEAAIAKP